MGESDWVMPRIPIVRDKGLAGRLGEEVILQRGKRDTETSGELIFYPGSFGVLGRHGKITSFKEGDRIYLRVSASSPNYSHYRRYQYKKG